MMGRPQQVEAAPYYFTYINRVMGDDVVGIIESQLEESSSFFSGISEESSLYRYEPEKWSIRQVRLSTISLFRNMPGEAWARSGIASDNPFTVRALAFIIAGHVMHHVMV